MGEQYHHDYIAGAFGGAAGLVVGHPFDTTKVQQQTRTAGHQYASTADAVKHIGKQGMSKGFFRGLSWPLISYGVVNGVFFGVYGTSLKHLQKYANGNEKPTYLHIYISGAIAGAAQLSVACPIDLIKVVLQSQIPDKQGHVGLATKGAKSSYYKGPVHCCVDIVRKRSIKGLYAGMTSMAWRDVPSFGLYCLAYEYLTVKLHEKKLTDERGVIASLIAGGVAGTITWFSIMPFDVVKSRYQADVTGVYKSSLDCAIHSFKEEGIRVFYRGTLITCLRAFPVNAVIFCVYSQILKHLKTDKSFQY